MTTVLINPVMSGGGGAAPAASISISVATTLDATYSGKQVLLSGTTTLTLGAATAVAGWGCWIKKSDAPLVGTITPSSGTIDGLSGIKVYNETLFIYYDGSTYRTADRARGWISAGTGSVASGAASLAISFFAGDTELRDIEFEFDNFVPSASADFNLTAIQGSASSFYGFTRTFSAGSYTGSQQSALSPLPFLGSNQSGARSGTLLWKNIQNATAYCVSLKGDVTIPTIGQMRDFFLNSSTAGALTSFTITPSSGTITSGLYELNVFRV